MALTEISASLELTQGQGIRVFEDKDGHCWFPAKQVIEALGKTWTGVALDTIPVDEWKRYEKIRDDRRGQTHRTTLINESGLIFLSLGRANLESDSFIKSAIGLLKCTSQRKGTEEDINTHREQFLKGLVSQKIDEAHNKRKTLYVVECGFASERFIKIGICNSIRKRLKTLQTGNPKPIQKIRTYNLLNARIVEQILHDSLIQEQVSGEWFSLKAGMLDRIDSIVNRMGHFALESKKASDEVVSSKRKDLAPKTSREAKDVIGGQLLLFN